MPIENRAKARVVIDTNVIISGLNFGGKPREILDLFRGGILEVCLSPFILQEVSGVLRTHFEWDEDMIKEVVDAIEEKSLLIKPKIKLTVIKEKEDDNRILECAVEGKAQFIISGDKRHILPLKNFRGIRIVNPDEFLKLSPLPGG